MAEFGGEFRGIEVADPGWSVARRVKLAKADLVPKTPPAARLRLVRRVGGGV